jgi:hypothetical protein
VARLTEIEGLSVIAEKMNDDEWIKGHSQIVESVIIGIIAKRLALIYMDKYMPGDNENANGDGI